jgi:hypothetical protein
MGGSMEEGERERETERGRERKRKREGERGHKKSPRKKFGGSYFIILAVVGVSAT